MPPKTRSAANKTTTKPSPKTRSKVSKKPLVGVIMGSSSDWETMKEAVAALQEMGISYEAKVVSAHRTPKLMVDYATSAAKRGLEVIIAGAGGAAHLPGMTASLTPLPVIGVPVTSKQLKGLDSLLSIVQMPAGIPVATVSIGNARNAGLLAARILGVKYPEYRLATVVFMAKQERAVLAQKLEDK
jgi:5-(carboxyamino)imidazole ribonucleotide mutase